MSSRSRLPRYLAWIGGTATLLAAGYYLMNRTVTTSDQPLDISETPIIQPVPVKRKGKRRLTISARDIIFWNPSQDPREPNVGFLEKAMSNLDHLFQSNLYDVTLICLVHSDEEEEQLQQLLQPILTKIEVVYCSTVEGKAHIARHLEPQIHVETDPSIVEKLGLHVPRIIQICKSNGGIKLAPPTSHKKPDRSSSVDLMEELAKDSPQNVELATSLSSCSLFRSAQ